MCNSNLAYSFNSISASALRAQQISKAQLPSQRRFYLALHEIADKAQPKIIKMFREAMESLKNLSTIRQVQQALETGSAAQVLSALGMDQQSAMLQSMARELQDVYRAAALESTSILPSSIRAAISFDLLNENSVRRLREFGGALITGISNTTREGVVSVIEQAFRRGGHPYEQARTIRSMIGLTPRQAQAVENFRAMLISEGLAPSVVRQRVERYTQRQLTYRARVIARTETIRASSAGQQEIWSQAVEQGLLDPHTARKAWIVTPDDRLCPICRPIPGNNPEGVPLDGFYDTPKGPMSGPPAHPQCRCAEALIAF